jgi:outer membrane protein OmpA-like peptidoglycan-associated protein
MLRRWAGCVLAGACLAACAPVIPKELVNARSAYSAMSAGQAKTSDEALRAREALSRAEQAYVDHGASRETRALAEEAEREVLRAQMACAQRGGAYQVAMGTSAEARVNDILTAVPGTVMFEFGEAELLPAAKERLDQLAAALVEVKKTDAPRTIIIEGYADAKGDEAFNKALSEKRAHAVRDYLSSRGYDPSYVQVRALGEMHPFTTNATAEGRANNRRVEILLGPKKAD